MIQNREGTLPGVIPEWVGGSRVGAWLGVCRVSVMEVMDVAAGGWTDVVGVGVLSVR